MIFEIAKVLREVSEHYFLENGIQMENLKEGFDDLINSDLVKIAPYDKFTLGTSYAIFLSRILNKANFETNPRLIAEKFCCHISAIHGQYWNVSIGEEAFINFEPTPDFCKKYFCELTSLDAASYFKKLISFHARTVDKSLEKRFLADVQSKSVSEADVLKLINSYTDSYQRKLVMLQFVSDKEFDLNLINKNLPVRDNAIWADIEFKKMIELMVGPESINSEISYSNASIDNADTMITKFMLELQELLIKLPFLFYESLTKNALEEFYVHILKMVNSFLNLVNDRTSRFVILIKRSKLRDTDLDQLSKRLIWFADFREVLLTEGIG